MDKITGCCGLVLVLNSLGTFRSLQSAGRYLSLHGEAFSLSWVKNQGRGIIGANFTAGFVAGAVTGAATCPLDVAKTRRQIEVKVTFSAGFRQQKHLNKANIWHSSS
ncbi:hypothetical protein Bca4012_000008 [Brassica carinata]|uniref:Uncharacterized protein n=1 Tax=Brassica carinata TaxID=52824 RepID=A0A8X7WPV6_BRACI|nr:hypothetical protein Bca52824_006144 [Brassica carinata]